MPFTNVDLIGVVLSLMILFVDLILPNLLHLFILNDKISLVRLLLWMGINPDAINSSGGALRTAIECQNHAAVELCLRYGSSMAMDQIYSPIYSAISLGLSDVVETFLKYGLKVNAETLEIACQYQKVEIFKLLLFGGVNNNIYTWNAGAKPPVYKPILELLEQYRDLQLKNSSKQEASDCVPFEAEASRHASIKGRDIEWLPNIHQQPVMYTDGSRSSTCIVARKCFRDGNRRALAVPPYAPWVLFWRWLHYVFLSDEDWIRNALLVTDVEHERLYIYVCLGTFVIVLFFA